MREIDDNDGINEMLDYLLQEMSDNEFVADLNEYFERRGNLTPKQYDVLCRMYWRQKERNER